MNMTGLSNKELRRFLMHSARTELAIAAGLELQRRAEAGELEQRTGRRMMGAQLYTETLAQEV